METFAGGSVYWHTLVFSGESKRRVYCWGGRSGGCVLNFKEGL